MEGGRSFLELAAWLKARRGRILACSLVAATSLGSSRLLLADDPASMRSLAQQLESPSSVFTEDENAVRISQAVEPERIYVRPVDPPPSLGLQMVPPKVTPMRVTANIVEPAPAIGLAIRQPTVTPQRVFVKSEELNHAIRLTTPQPTPMPEPPGLQRVATNSEEPPPISLSVVEPPVVVPEPIISVPAPGFARFESPQPTTPSQDAMQIAGLTVAMADQPPPAPAAEGSGPTIGTGAGSGSIATVDKLGDAPPTNSLAFLRQQALLLEPGKYQFDWGLTYSVFNATFSLPVVDHSGNIVGVANERERLRLMTIPLAFRYGVCPGVQAYINAPLGWANSELTTDTGASVNNNFGGLADMSAGFSFQLMKGCGAWCPDVVGSLGFVAPTGHATFATSLLSSNSFLGQGFWDITTNVIAVHTIDPVLFYYGAGYVHRFYNTIDGVNVNPGEEFDYLFGVGFAMNPWVTVSGTLLGATITRYGANGVSLPGTDQDPIRFRISVTMVKDSRICEPFAEIAMTPDSPSRVGITFTY
jgi:hypothetical protein